MRRALIILAGLAVIGAGAGLALTRAVPLPASAFDGTTGDVENGAQVFTAAGCASCHTAPQSDDKTVLAGGQRFSSDFGTFIAPNISPDPEAGIGGWTLPEFASAVTRGVSPEGAHYYPAFPYTSYALMRDQDVADLWAYMQTLPPDPTQSRAHEVGFPFNIRRALGGWKLMYFRPDWVMDTGGDPVLERGRYLVEALAHCAECHTPRDALGGLDRGRWMAGAPNPSGSGRIPALTPDALTWSAGDIAYYLETGFTPDYDSAGGHMVTVVENFAKLSKEDRDAVAAYVKALSAP